MCACEVAEAAGSLFECSRSAHTDWKPSNGVRPLTWRAEGYLLHTCQEIAANEAAGARSAVGVAEKIAAEASWSADGVMSKTV